MKRFLLFSFTSLSAYVLLAGCSSSGGGGAGAPPCDDAGLCSNPALVCQGGFCVQPPGSGGSGQGGAQGGTGNVGTGGGPSGGTGNVGTGGVPSGGSGGVPSGGSGGVPSGGTGGGGTGGGGNCGDLGFTNPACGSCMNSYCCNELLACDSTSQCYGLLACIQQYCATDPDVGACAEQYCSAYADGVTDYNAVNTCLETNCLTDCGG
jgi:hypothetical protein